MQLSYHTCLDMQQERVIEEYDTTANIMKAQANIFSQRAQEEYLQNYFVNTRMTTLAEKMTKLVGLLEIINTKYTEGTKMCN
ncbi:MAG: hypothetical protein H6766_07095 [Candidatus Peribacteria bacterium]|nr:MAG: hypothetical protein H6766_07095 [Candidatus Peribacteria bacterium]